LANKAPTRQLSDLPLVDRRLGGEVEAIEIADKGEPGEANAHLDAALVFAGDLAFAE
jgi:hypothetical protein